jgi:predicted ArsR family transcriptional regulator
LGQEGIKDIFFSIADRLAREAPPAQENQSVEDRLNQVKAYLEEKGFVVDWESGEDTYMLHAYSCPYRQIAKKQEYVCLLDKHIISSMLNADPNRISCLADGDSHCIYRISKPIELILDPVQV